MIYLNRILNIFSPAPHLKEIEDLEEIKTTYTYWRIRIIYSMFFGYALYYFTRKSFTFAIPGLIEELQFDKGQIGLLGSIFSIVYGLSKFGSGIISDRSNPRYFMAIGLMFTGVVNILFGMSNSFYLLAFFWALNGYFQGFGWPPCAKFLTHWYSKSERGSWWSIWNISHNLGAFLIPWIVGITLQYFNWRYAMYVPGIICILGGCFLINRLRDTPQSLGLPPIEKFRNDYSSVNDGTDEEKQLSSKEILVNHVLKNKSIWLLAFAYFFIYIVRTGINDWTMLYLSEQKDYSTIASSGSVSLFEIGGVFGSLAAGWASDYFFKAKRGPVNVFFTVGLTFSIIIFWLIPKGYVLLDSCFIFLIGFMIFGPQMLIGLTAAELSHKKAAATSTGFTGSFAYIGAAVSGYPLGKLTEDFGWNGFFIFMIVCCFCALALLIPLWGTSKSFVTDDTALEEAA